MSFEPVSGPRNAKSPDPRSRHRLNRKSNLARCARRSALSFLREPGFELLETRRLLSTINWSNMAGGDWDTLANWSGGQLPGPGDDVFITVPNNVAITHSVS